MLETFAAVGLVGFILGWLGGRRQSDPKPMRLVSVHAMTPPMLAPKAGAELGQWELYVCAFAWHATMLHSWSFRTLTGASVVRRAGWECYTGLLREAGVIQAGDRSRTDWAGGWSYCKLRTALKHGRLALPYPAGGPPALNSPLTSTLKTRHNTGRTDGTRHAYAL
jgi:hypothetical protein